LKRNLLSSPAPSYRPDQPLPIYQAPQSVTDSSGYNSLPETTFKSAAGIIDRSPVTSELDSPTTNPVLTDSDISYDPAQRTLEDKVSFKFN
jgi:hypothetical protein